MHPRYVVPAVFVVIIGVLLLGRGLTGMVISQSCCFPPDCPAEYLCDAAEPHVEQPLSVTALNTGLGTLLLLSALGYYLLARVKARSD